MDIIEIVRNYLEIPYFYKGRGRGGIDCGGTFIKLVQATIDSSYSFSDYSANPNPRIIIKEITKYADKVNPPLKHGDILLISLSGLPQHIAYYTEDNTIVHTYQDIGKVTEEKYTKYWQNKLHSIYRLRI